MSEALLRKGKGQKFPMGAFILNQRLFSLSYSIPNTVITQSFLIS